jgi:choice-of-anchor A domain-containing protein
MFFTCTRAALTLLVIGAGFAQADQLSFGAATGYNVFVFNNFSEYNTDAQGRMAVGGNFAPADNGGFTIAGSNSSDGAGTYDLVVGGSFTNTNYSMGGGDIYVGGSMTWTNPTLPHSAYVVGDFTNSGGGSVGGTIYYGGNFNSSATYLSHQKDTSLPPAPIDFASAKTSLDSLSNTLAGESPNGTVTLSYGTYSLTGTNATLNVFNLTGGSFSGNAININAPAGSTVVVNVSGGADSFSNGSINLNGVSTANVIFNFDAATTLALSGIGFNATILAPFADFTGSSGNINGQLIANSAAGTTQLNEVLFAGNLGSSSTSFPSGGSQVQATPEPATWLMMVPGAVIILIALRIRLPNGFYRHLNHTVIALGRGDLAERRRGCPICVERAQIAGRREVRVIEHVEQFGAELQVERLRNSLDVVVFVDREVQVEERRSDGDVASQVATDVGAGGGGQRGAETAAGTVAIGSIGGRARHEREAGRVEFEE